MPTNTQGFREDVVHPTLWSGDWCEPCPAAAVCTSVGTADACGEPSEYPRRSLHPAGLSPTTSAMQLDFAAPPGHRRDDSFPTSPTMVVGDGKDTIATGVRLQNCLSTRSRPPPPAEQHLIAVLHGSDQQLNRLTRRRGLLRTLLPKAGFTGVIAPGYSTWAPHSPFESVVSMALSAATASDLATSLPTVPTIVWRNHQDLERWALWIADGRWPAIAMHPGSLRSPSEWSWWLECVDTLARALRPHGPTPRLLVNGPSVPGRIVDVVDAWSGELTFVSRHPWDLARNGKALDPSLHVQRAARSEQRADLLAANAESFRQFVVRALVERSHRNRNAMECPDVHHS
jgi:hypothetical protein